MAAEHLTLDGDLGWQPEPALVMTAHCGANDALIAHAARLHIPDGALVLDCTWGKGAFWRRTDATRFRLIGTDLVGGPAARADFRALPFASSSLDRVILDPPYVHSTTQPRHIHDAYRNNETTPGRTVAEILELYRAGMTEARRVLRDGGQLWVKCQDTVSARVQVWNGIAIHGIGLDLGMYPRDLFVLVNPTPPGRHSGRGQQHARRNHSYLWIFDVTYIDTAKRKLETA